MTTQGRARIRRSRRESVAHPLRAGAMSLVLAALLLLGALGGSALASPQGAGLGARLDGAGTALGAHPDAETLPPKVTSQPISATVPEGAAASFASAASNSPTIQWEISTDGGVTFHPIEGATSGTYSIAATVVAESGDQFRAVFTNAGGSATSKAATLTVTQKPVVTQQPVDANAAEGHEASFESRASGSPAPTTQWQESTDGGVTFKNLTGVTQTKLTLQNLSKSQDGSEVPGGLQKHRR